MLNRGSNSGSNDLPEQVNLTTSKHDSNSPHSNSTGTQTVAERISETQSVASTGTPIVQESNGGVKPHNQNSESSGVTSVTSTSLLHYTGVLGHSSKSGSAGLTEQEITIASKNDSSSSNTDSIGNQVNSTSAPMPQSVASFDTPITQESDDKTDSKHSDSAIPESELSVSDTKSTNNNQQPEKDNTPSFIEDTHRKSGSHDNSQDSSKDSHHTADCRSHPRERVKNDAEGHVKSEPISENSDDPYVRPNLSEIGAGVAVVGGVVTIGGVIVGSTFVTALGVTAVVIGGTCYFLEGK